jgi:hypothetical protein
MKKYLMTRPAIVLWSCAALLTAQWAASAQTLAHEYQFYNPENDGLSSGGTVPDTGTPGGNVATLFGDAITSGGQLELDGTAGTYVQLQPGIVTNDLAVTVEAWGLFPALSSQGLWANLFDFGKAGVADGSGRSDSYSISFCVDSGNPSGALVAGISDFDDANMNRQNANCDGNLIATSTPGTYVAVVFNPTNNTASPGAGYEAIYVNGVLEATAAITNNITPGVKDVSNLIGYDNWPDNTMYGGISEFRVWNGALNGLQIAASYTSGQSTVGTNAGAILSLTLTAPYQLTVGGQAPSTVLATAEYTGSISINVTKICAYASSDTNILTVNPTTGVIMGVAVGSASITATLGGQSSSWLMSVVEPMAILTHRYSFQDIPNTTGISVADSVGTLNGTAMGDAIETTVGTNQVFLMSGNVGSYLDLSSNSFVNNGIISGYQSATVDFWGTFTSLAGNWEYGYSFGQSYGYGVDFLYFSVHAGGGDHFLNESTSGGNAGLDMNGTFANETVHCTTIIDPISGNLAMFTNGILSGVLNGYTVPLSTIATNFIYFGRSLWTAVGPDGAGDPYLTADSSFNEIRVYNGALSPQQVAMADQSGPGSTNLNYGTLQSLSLQVPSTLQWLQTGKVKLLANYTYLSNWDIIGNSLTAPPGLTVTSSDTNVAVLSGSQVQGVGLGAATITVSYQGTTNSAVISVIPPAYPTLTHRYHFANSNANDTVGTANGTLMGNATITGGQLVIPNTTSAAPATDYLQLPYGIITNATGLGTNYNDPTATYNDPEVTVEAWASFAPGQYGWAALFDFGNTDSGGLGEYDIHVGVHSNPQTIIGISDSDNANSDYQYANALPDQDGQTNVHFVAVFNPPAGYLALYTNGVLMTENTGVTIPMAGVWGYINKIGADLWPDPGMQGSVSEFRIYNGVLSPIQAAATDALGPNQLLNGASPILGATFSGGNLTLSWPLVSAGFSLYSSPTLNPRAVWTLVSGKQTVVGQTVQVTVSAHAGAANYYKLAK